jgi:SPX domain protein involved in polyphosphate accumulation
VHLASSKRPDWQWQYIEYEQLKNALTPTSQSTWTDEDEERFVNELESELDKVFTFQKVKSHEIVLRIKATEAEVYAVVAQENAPGHRPSEAQYELLESELSDIISDVDDLADFTRLNYTGFNKIIKKHDVCLLGSGDQA